MQPGLWGSHWGRSKPPQALRSAPLVLSAWMHQGLTGPDSGKDLSFRCVIVSHRPRAGLFPRPQLLWHSPGWGKKCPTGQPSPLHFPLVMSNIQRGTQFSIPDSQCSQTVVGAPGMASIFGRIFGSGSPFRGGKTASLPLKCLGNGRVEHRAGQPNTAGRRAQRSAGCSHKSFLVPNLIQLILGEFCRSAPPGR